MGSCSAFYKLLVTPVALVQGHASSSGAGAVSCCELGGGGCSEHTAWGRQPLSSTGEARRLASKRVKRYIYSDLSVCQVSFVFLKKIITHNLSVDRTSLKPQITRSAARTHTHLPDLRAWDCCLSSELFTHVHFAKRTIQEGLSFYLSPACWSPISLG